jgi:hypothetical protein
MLVRKIFRGRIKPDMILHNFVYCVCKGFGKIISVSILNAVTDELVQILII